MLISVLMFMNVVYYSAKVVRVESEPCVHTDTISSAGADIEMLMKSNLFMIVSEVLI